MSSRHNSRRSDSGLPPTAPRKRWGSSSQPQGKANYRLMTSNAPRRPSRQQRQTALDSVSQGEEEQDSVPGTSMAGTSRQERYSYRKPTDPKVASAMALVARYVKERNLMARMMDCSRTLLERDSLPYNPYPEFESKIRQEAERFHMFSKANKAVKAELTSKLAPSMTPHLHGVKGYGGAWGLEPVLHGVSPKGLKQYEWLIEDLSPAKLNVSDDYQEYTGQILVALIGPATFTGTLYPEPPSVDIRMEFVIYGPSLDTALFIFTNSISEDIRLNISSDSPHRILGIVVPGSRPSGETVGASLEGFWAVDEARNQWDAFWDSIKNAVKGKCPITVQFVFLLNKENKVYRAGTKQFILHFVETSEKTTKEKFTSFAPLPYQTLYEGLFVKKAHADAYITTMKRHQEAGGQSGPGPAQQAGRRGKGTAASLVPEEEEGEGEENLVLAEATRKPLRKSWQRQIAGLHPVRDAFRLAHLTLLLALSDNGEQSAEVMVELHRFLHSTAAAFHIATAMLSTLHLLAMTTPPESEEGRQCLAHWHSECRRKLLSVLDGKLHARSSEFHVAHSVLAKLCGRLSDQDDSKPLNLDVLQEIQDYCATLQFLLTEDAMSFFKRLNFQTLVSGCKEALNATTTKNTETAKKKSTKTKSNTSVTPPAVNPILASHGVESKEITQQKNIVIDVEQAKSLSNWPRIMATEAVLMQYLVDVKLDLVWHEYLQELLTGDSLPPNPYPRLVTVLRQAAHRMQLCAETDSALSARLLRPGQARLVDRGQGVYAAASLAIYTLSHHTLAGLDADPGAFVKVAKVMTPLASKDAAVRRGQFQIEVSQAVGQTGAFYGRLVPYLTTLHMYDNYYIRGPIGADSEAIQLYTKLIYEYISKLSAKREFIIVGMYFDGSDFYLTEEDLKTDKGTFMSSLDDAARQKQDMYLKIYRQINGWRYLCLHKHFVLHYLYVDNNEDRHICYGPVDPSSAYQYVFLSQEEAASHSRGGGPEQQMRSLEGAAQLKAVSDYLSQQIEGALVEHQVTRAYELVLQRALLSKDAKGVATAWRVLHSQAFQLGYLQTVNRDLRSLLHYALAFPARVAKETPSGQALTKGWGSKGKGKADPVQQGQLSDAKLASFLAVYVDKLAAVLGEPCAFVPASLRESVKERLAAVLASSPDDKTQTATLPIEEKTVKALEKIHRQVQAVLDWTAYDVHKAISQHGGDHIVSQD